MGKGEFLVVESALTALYLRGTPHRCRLRRRHWCLVRDALCSLQPSFGDVSLCLKEAGLWDESAAADWPGVLDWAADHLLEGRATTAVSEDYPQRWLETLGSAAPPCLWKQGPLVHGKPIAVVGNRILTGEDSSFAQAVGAQVIEGGLTLVTGGAVGADSVTIRSALDSGATGRIAVLLPCGFQHAPFLDGVTYLSVCEPTAPFSAGQAMERNALIYASSPLTVVVRARLRAGGTWHGAIDALRRRLTTLAVRQIPSDPASTALHRLGALTIESAQEINNLYREASMRDRAAKLEFDQPA